MFINSMFIDFKNYSMFMNSMFINFKMSYIMSYICSVRFMIIFNN